MLLSKAIVIVILTCISVKISYAQYGSGCLTPNNEEGKCVPLRSCAGAYELLVNVYKYGENRFKNEVSYLQASKCESFDNTHLICCPQESIQINPIVYNHLKKLNCGLGGIPKIANGKKAGLFNFRWMVVLKYNGNVPFACGGSLIDERHVLTAAHCLHERPIAVRVSEYNLMNETDYVVFGKHKKFLDRYQDIGIEDVIIHEDYVYKSSYHDVAILRLEHPVHITKSVLPICLPITKSLQLKKPKDFIVAGWGLTEKGQQSDVLLWTSIPNQPLSLCQKTIGVTLSEEHICAGGYDFHDKCKGDSGGPLFDVDTYADGVARSIQYGIVSFGAAECGVYKIPGVYMNVQHYIQWITDHMQIE